MFHVIYRQHAPLVRALECWGPSSNHRCAAKRHRLRLCGEGARSSTHHCKLDSTIGRRRRRQGTQSRHVAQLHSGGPGAPGRPGHHPRGDVAPPTVMPTPSGPNLTKMGTSATSPPCPHSTSPWPHFIGRVGTDVGGARCPSGGL